MEDERKKRGKKEGGRRDRERVDAVMRSIAMATTGAGALIYIVPREGRRESKWETKEKRERDRES